MSKAEPDWNRLYKKYLKSGLSVAGFARTENLAPSTVSAHFRKLVNKQDNDSAIKAEPDVPVDLIPIQILKHETQGKSVFSGLNISVSNLELHISADTDRTLLREVLMMVRDIC